MEYALLHPSFASPPFNSHHLWRPHLSHLLSFISQMFSFPLLLALRGIFQQLPHVLSQPKLRTFRYPKSLASFHLQKTPLHVLQ